MKNAKPAVRDVRKPVRSAAAPTSGPLPLASAPARGAVGDAAYPAVPPIKRGRGRPRKQPAAPVAAKDFAAAVALITRSEATGDGWRAFLLGDTGAGKTCAAQALLEAKRGRSLRLIHDDSKARPQYAGVVWSDLEIGAAPEDADTLVFRGDPYAGTRVNPDGVAALALTLARQRIPITLVIDELSRACTPGGKELASESLRECQTQGRSMGLNMIVSTQSPQRAPGEVIDQASAIVLCRLGPRALNYLDDRLFFDPALLAVAATLPDLHCVVHVPGVPWNREVYAIPLPPARPAAAARDVSTVDSPSEK